MRIISGKYGSRKLVSFKADHLRPTSDRVKESLFNILMGRWEGARVLDLFAGTGNLGLEALSRGAGMVVSVELEPRSLAIIRKNMELLKVGREMKVVRADVKKFLREYRGEPFDIILIDPPFTEKMADSIMAIVSRSAVLKDDSTIAIESTEHETIQDAYGDLVCIDRRDFGDKMLSFFERKG